MGFSLNVLHKLPAFIFDLEIFCVYYNYHEESLNRVERDLHVSSPDPLEEIATDLLANINDKEYERATVSFLVSYPTKSVKFCRYPVAL